MNDPIHACMDEWMDEHINKCMKHYMKEVLLNAQQAPGVYSTEVDAFRLLSLRMT